MTLTIALRPPPPSVFPRPSRPAPQEDNISICSSVHSISSSSICDISCEIDTNSSSDSQSSSSSVIVAVGRRSSIVVMAVVVVAVVVVIVV